MKFINYLTSITDIDIYPMISLFIFTGVFAAVLFVTFRASKQTITEHKNLPLD